MKEKTYIIKVKPATEFQQSVLDSIIATLLYTVKAHAESSHKKNKVSITIEKQ